MTNRAHWLPVFSVGNDLLDQQHKTLLDRCTALADLLDSGAQDADARFRDDFTALIRLAREHFATEEALLIRCAYPDLDELRDEREEFDHLADEVATTENFDPDELQNFLTLFWVGHIAGSAKKQREYLAALPRG